MDTNVAMHIRSKKISDEVEAATRALINATNVMGEDEAIAKGLLDGIRKSHPTLQQTFFKALSAVMKEYGDTMGDDRNKASREWAKKVSKIESYFPFI